MNSGSVSVSPARSCAFEALLNVEVDRAFVTPLLASERFILEKREDRALLQELVLGVVRWQGLLDFLIERYSRRPASRIDTKVLIALRLGLYQLRFLTRVPAHAAINESVNLVRQHRLRSATSFVNAVLRSAQRELSATVDDLTRDLVDSLEQAAIRTSHPAWLLRRWSERLGEDEANQLAMAANRTPAAAFRFNPVRAPVDQTTAWLGANNISFRGSRLVSDAYVIESGHLPPDAEAVSKGWLYLQDEASQLVAAAALDLREISKNRTRILDLCAAPGSKATLIASRLQGDSIIVACDLHLHRLRAMQTIAARLGVTRLQRTALDASTTLPFRASSFESVLIDAPCSGLGTLAKHPEIKWRLGENNLRELANLQSDILTNGASAVRRGGLLTYAVCSTEPEEGEDVIAKFKSGHPEFRDVTRERLVELGVDWEPLLTSQFGARSFTHRQGSESFFLCVLWKRQ